MEDIICKYDGTVRNSVGEIVQFLYGEDGLNAMHIEQQTLETMMIGTAQFDKMVFFFFFFFFFF